MRTYTHFFLTAVLYKRGAQGEQTRPGPSFLAGSILPDLPLALLTGGFLLWGRTQCGGDWSYCGAEYDRLFFHNPGWILAYNLFHAPLLLLAYGLLGWWGWRREAAWGRPLFWLALGSGLHTLVDIPTHATDGPLLFFPFDWQTRFHSPISYWDPKYGGRIVRRVESVLVLASLLYLLPGIWRWWRQRRQEPV